MARGMRIGVIILTFKHVPGFSPVLAIKNNGWSNKSSSKHETKSRFQRCGESRGSTRERCAGSAFSNTPPFWWRVSIYGRMLPPPGCSCCIQNNPPFAITFPGLPPLCFLYYKKTHVLQNARNLLHLYIFF